MAKLQLCEFPYSVFDLEKVSVVEVIQCGNEMRIIEGELVGLLLKKVKGPHTIFTWDASSEELLV